MQRILPKTLAKVHLHCTSAMGSGPPDPVAKTRWASGSGKFVAATSRTDIRPIRAETRAKLVAAIAGGRRWRNEIEG